MGEMLIDVNFVKQDQIDDQIKVREELIGQMVGTLYPRILSGEIDKLKAMRDDFINQTEMKIE